MMNGLEYKLMMTMDEGPSQFLGSDFCMLHVPLTVKWRLFCQGEGEPRHGRMDSSTA